MATHLFENDDAGYLEWLETHPNGFVLNARSSPTGAYLRLHRATCHHITTLPAGYSQWTSGDYLKVCADTETELADWARRRTGGELERRCYCLA